MALYKNITGRTLGIRLSDGSIIRIRKHNTVELDRNIGDCNPNLECLDAKKVAKCKRTEWVYSKPPDNRLKDVTGHSVPQGKHFEIVEMPLDKLWQSCPSMKTKKKGWYENLKKAIDRDGLEVPLIVVPSTVGKTHELKKKHGDSLMQPPGGNDEDECFVIWGGSNRYSVLKELGYTHVDCVLMNKDDFQSGFKLQAQQRHGYEYLNKSDKKGGK